MNTLFESFEDVPLSSVSENRMLSIIPFLPERGYIGTKTDIKMFILFSKAVYFRPAYLVRAFDRYRNHTFYTVVGNARDFRQVKDTVICNYIELYRYAPEIRFMAKLATNLN